MATVRRRHVEALLDRLLGGIPALMLTGPRSVGKTTLALARAASVLRLDTPADAAAARLDPDGVLRGRPEPLLVDEWQVVPEILPAVKRAVDDDPRGGRFLLTGSVEGETGPGLWAGTGRVVNLPLWGLTVAERDGRGTEPTFVDRLVEGHSSAADFATSSNAPTDYVALALASGFPVPALDLSGEARAVWLASYVDQAVLRDVADVGARNPALLRRYVEALALNSAGVVTAETLVGAAGINRRTAVAYEADLQRVYLLDVVEPWFTNRLNRLVKLPKRYLTDAALIPAALGLGRDDVAGDTDLLGRVLDTFVASQLRAQLAARVPAPRLHHLRNQDGTREVDLLVEAAGAVYAFEVKASATPQAKDARHLRWLRDALGERFGAGVVFTTNPHPIDLDDRIVALPISALWT